MVRHCNSDVLEGELVSVLMPVYNGERYLDQAVKSIINQTYKNIEIVIVDDGSFDRSIEIIKYYMSLDGRVKAYFLPHSGLVAALNYGLVKCKGNFVVRMDADDIALPNRVERLFSCIVRSQLLVVGSAVSLMDESGKRLRDGNVPVGVEKVKNRLRHSSCIFHPTVIFRRESVLSAGGYRSQFKAAEDYDLWLRLAEKGGLNNISESV
ncbi:glycosyltransferase family 2 protein [Brucella intermedia]|uniref:glycosyltransferase family 2 protein n=1 Tax=Brucella intermedia TaxID=94625 RepID=UPI00124C31B1|nr:glycosyltransferase [Brucella intermedia]KAB2692450.1 glycosyltransferase [Brucella intermedia]